LCLELKPIDLSKPRAEKEVAALNFKPHPFRVIFNRYQQAYSPTIKVIRLAVGFEDLKMFIIFKSSSSIQRLLIVIMTKFIYSDSDLPASLDTSAKQIAKAKELAQSHLNIRATKARSVEVQGFF